MGGEGVADRCGQFFSDSFKKRDSSIVVCTFFNFEDSKPGPISGEKKVFDAEPSRKGGHWVREGVADRSGHWTRVDQGQSTSL